jgi:hypothetical protein
MHLELDEEHAAIVAAFRQSPDAVAAAGREPMWAAALVVAAVCDCDGPTSSSFRCKPIFDGMAGASTIRPKTRPRWPAARWLSALSGRIRESQAPSAVLPALGGRNPDPPMAGADRIVCSSTVPAGRSFPYTVTAPAAPSRRPASLRSRAL